MELSAFDRHINVVVDSLRDQDLYCADMILPISTSKAAGNLQTVFSSFRAPVYDHCDDLGVTLRTRDL
jgi:hypothetical protein